MTKDGLKRSDQIELLKAALHREKTGEWKGMFTYPNCGHDLVRSGLATEDGKLTIAGKAALYLLGNDEADPTADSKSFQSFELPLR
jgi:hypothetical protein